MKHLVLVGALALALSGCASFAADTGSVAANVSAAVTDTANVSKGAVAIVTDLANAVKAIVGPVATVVTVAAPLL